MENFGLLVKQAREELFLTLPELAKAAGVGIETLRRIEKNPACEVNSLTLYKLCDSLGLEEPLSKIPVIRLERYKRHMTLQAAAQKIGVGQDALYSAETSHGASLSVIKKICAFFGLNEDVYYEQQSC